MADLDRRDVFDIFYDGGDEFILLCKTIYRNHYLFELHLDVR